MKKIVNIILGFGILLIAAGLIFYVKDDVYVYVDQYLSPYKYVDLDNKNEYYREQDFEFVQNTEHFVPLSSQDIMNIYYTVINSGQSSFTFYCTDDFPGCLEAVRDVANDRNMLSDINNYVHPYNGFSHIETEYDSLGKITINIVRNYTPEQIDAINQKVEELSLQLINYNDSDYNNIMRVHDYIIDHASYDTPRAKDGDTTYDSDTAYGALFQGKAVCGGYSDAMQLFLEKLQLKNFKVSSEKHVWNAVYINGQWLNLDLTWDDPVYDDGHQVVNHEFFLINTRQLQKIEQAEHTFNVDHYPELKEA